MDDKRALSLLLGGLLIAVLWYLPIVVFGGYQDVKLVQTGLLLFTGALGGLLYVLYSWRERIVVYNLLLTVMFAYLVIDSLGRFWNFWCRW